MECSSCQACASISIVEPGREEPTEDRRLGRSGLFISALTLGTMTFGGRGVRYVGSSNYSGWQLMKALGTSERLRLQRYISQQIHYTLQAREAEYELVPLAIDQECPVLVWSPLAGGLLSGKYRRDRDASEGRHVEVWDEPPVYDTDKLYHIVEVLVEVADDRGVSAAQVALAWLLGRPGVASVIIGARTHEQLAGNLRASCGAFSSSLELLRSVRSVF